MMKDLEEITIHYIAGLLVFLTILIIKYLKKKNNPYKISL
jgi:hypothetical protein